jgi:metacaspase-1
MARGRAARRRSPRSPRDVVDAGSAGEPLRVLCLHGVGHHGRDLAWQERWREAITRSVRRWAPRRHVELSFPLYDDLFEAADLSLGGLVEAVWKLTLSGVAHGFRDLRPRRGLLDIPDRVRWTAGMVVQWVENERLQRQTRELVSEAVTAFRPDVICAHSLGSLIGYDAFSHRARRALLESRVFASFGSQIGNPFVRERFGGRITGLAGRRWVHLYNPHDDVFTADLAVEADNFEQVLTPFDLPGVGDHDADAYLAHPRAVERLWRPVAGVPLSRALRRSQAVVTRASRRPRRRALLVGINAYPDPKDRLEGCVNDVFLMSTVLQETGFDAEDIRVVFDDRATAAGLRERLEWLLDGARETDERLFYYSGHGAQIPGYGVGEKVDGLDECLVPHDFDWSRERALTDDHLFELYSQLSYETRFAMILDCCHSGG